MRRLAFGGIYPPQGAQAVSYRSGAMLPLTVAITVKQRMAEKTEIPSIDTAQGEEVKIRAAEEKNPESAKTPSPPESREEDLGTEMPDDTPMLKNQEQMPAVGLEDAGTDEEDAINLTQREAVRVLELINDPPQRNGRFRQARARHQAITHDVGVAHVTPVGGNVFADLGFEPEEATALKTDSQRIIAETLAIKDSLMTEVAKWIETRKHSQAEAAAILGLNCERLSNLVHKKTQEFTIDALVDIVLRTGKHVSITGV